MSKPYNIRYIKALLVFLPSAIGLFHESQAQIIYGATGYPQDALWQFNAVGCSCDITYIGPLETPGGTPVWPEGDIALCPDGNLFMNAYGQMYNVNT